MNIQTRHNPNGFQGNAPRLIVVHCMGQFLDYEGERLHAVDFLERIGLSTHAVVDQDGTVYRCRDDHEGAYHAGGHNEDSLGVELLVSGAHNLAELKDRSQQVWLTSTQYNAALDQVREWMDVHEIQRDDIVRHSDLDPERKWFDPGESFPWRLFLSDLNRKRRTS